MSPLERAARTLAVEVGTPPEVTGSLYLRAVYVQGEIDLVAMARAVVAAIRSPSAAMVEAAGGFNKDRAAERYTAMLDALLKETDDG